MALGQKRDLLVTEAALEAAAEATGGADSAIWSQLGGFKVFARMSPQGKAKVIRNLQQRSGAKVFMCGDGGNDVGALKQADVGLALLSGYGNTNTNADAPETVKGAGGDPTAGDAEKALNAQAMLLQRKAAESARLAEGGAREEAEGIAGTAADLAARDDRREAGAFGSRCAIPRTSHIASSPSAGARRPA